MVNSKQPWSMRRWSSWAPHKQHGHAHRSCRLAQDLGSSNGKEKGQNDMWWIIDHNPKCGLFTGMVFDSFEPRNQQGQRSFSRCVPTQMGIRHEGFLTGPTCPRWKWLHGWKMDENGTWKKPSPRWYQMTFKPPGEDVEGMLQALYKICWMNM